MTEARAHHRLKVTSASRDRPWLTVGLLSFLYICSFVDRMILSLLMDPLRRDLLISEAQLGVLFGWGFGLAYVGAGLPLGHWADQGNRRNLLVGGVLIWSLSTAIAGLATGFGMLLVARAGVGIGEAVLTPVAISLIADLFPPSRRALPTSIFTTIGAVSGSAAIIIGGGAIWLAERIVGIISLPMWRVTFMLVTIPGFLGAIAFAFLIREPARRADHGVRQDFTVKAAIRYFGRRIRAYAGLFAGVGCMLTQAMALVAWGPTMMARSMGLPLTRAGTLFGIAAVAGSVIGTFSVPLLMRYVSSRNPARMLILFAIAYSAITAPLAAIGLASSSIATVVLAIMIGFVGLAANAVIPPMLIQLVTPAGLRARGAAGFLLLSNVISLGVGPLLVALVAAKIPGGDLKHALALTGWITVACALVCFAISLVHAYQFYEEDE